MKGNEMALALAKMNGKCDAECGFIMSQPGNKKFEEETWR